MAVKLTKGGRVNLTKGTGLTKAKIGLGWDTNRYQGSEDFDLDLVIFQCGANGKNIDDDHLVFYNTKKDENDEIWDPEKAVMHSGDNRTGAGDGDDETAFIEFAKINPNVQKLVIAVTIFDAKARNQNFGLVDNAFVRIVNTETQEEILRYDLGEDFSTQLSVIFAEIYKHEGEWKFRAVGEGYTKELIDLCKEYGVDVE